MTNYPNEALTAVCEMLLDEWEITDPEWIKNLAADLPGECEGILQNRAEAAYERQQERLMESGGPDDGYLRWSLKEAGRGHLIR